MSGILKWQFEYGFKKSGNDVKNLIMPCGIRDHYKFTHRHIEKTQPLPIDDEAAKAFNDSLYYKGLVDYNERLASLTEEIWDREFIGNGK